MLRNWTGPVFVHVWGESLNFVADIATDNRLDIEIRYREPKLRGKNSQFLDKIQMMMDCPTRLGVYLDADLLVQKPIDRLFAEAEKPGFVATQFNDWKSTGKTISGRIKRLIDREPINQQAVQLVLLQTFPSVNGGVFAARRDSEILPIWYEWSVAVKDVFIADETVLHVLLAEYDATGRIEIIKGGHYNCSPKHKPEALDDNDVVIWHMHGDCNLRPEKSSKGYSLWWPVYERCKKFNVGKINDWVHLIGNRYLKKLEESKHVSSRRPR